MICGCSSAESFASECLSCQRCARKHFVNRTIWFSWLEKTVTSSTSMVPASYSARPASSRTSARGGESRPHVPRSNAARNAAIRRGSPVDRVSPESRLAMRPLPAPLPRPDPQRSRPIGCRKRPNAATFQIKAIQFHPRLDSTALQTSGIFEHIDFAQKLQRPVQVLADRPSHVAGHGTQRLQRLSPPIAEFRAMQRRR